MKNFLLTIGTNSTIVNGGGDLSGAFTFTDFFIVAIWLVIGLLALAIVCFILSLFTGVIVSVLSRLSFIAMLKKWAKNNGYSFKQQHSSLRSLFYSYSGEDVIINREEKTYNIKFFPYILKFRSVIIGENDKVSLSRYEKRRLDLSFKRDGGQNVIILAPDAHTMRLVDKNEYVVIDNGVVYKNGAIFYDANGFFRRIREETA